MSKLSSTSIQRLAHQLPPRGSPLGSGLDAALNLTGLGLLIVVVTQYAMSNSYSFLTQGEDFPQFLVGQLGQPTLTRANNFFR